MLDSANLVNLAGELAASRLGLGLLYLPASCVLVPCQLYLHLVATRHYRTIQQVITDTRGVTTHLTLQVKRSIQAKEVSDHAFLSCTPTSALRTGRVCLDTPALTSHRVKSHR